MSPFQGTRGRTGIKKGVRNKEISEDQKRGKENPDRINEGKSFDKKKK